MIVLNNHAATILAPLIARYTEDAPVRQGLAGLFPNKTYRSEGVRLQVQRNKGLMAVDVMRCTGANKNKWSAWTEKLFIPPLFAEEHNLCECDSYDLVFGNSDVLAENITYFNQDALDKLRQLRDKIWRAIELQRWQIAQTGVVILHNGDSIDYKRKATSMKVVTTDWDNANATIGADLQAGMEFLRSQGQSSSTEVNAIMGANAFANFINNSKIQNELDIRRYERGYMDMPVLDNVTGLAYQGTFGFGDFRFNILTYNETYVDPIDGSIKRYLGTDNVVMFAGDFIGETAFGAVRLPQRNSNGNTYIQVAEGEFGVYDYVSQTLDSYNQVVKSAPLALPITIDRIYTIKTKA